MPPTPHHGDTENTEEAQRIATVGAYLRVRPLLSFEALVATRGLLDVIDDLV
jgi:hypothetical protein